MLCIIFKEASNINVLAWIALCILYQKTNVISLCNIFYLEWKMEHRGHWLAIVVKGNDVLVGDRSFASTK